MFCIDFYRKNIITIFLSETTSLDICYVASPSRPLPSVLKLCPWGQNWSCPRGHMFCGDLYRENMKKTFLSETTGPSALIFGM